jgi:hypothetical protein
MGVLALISGYLVVFGVLTGVTKLAFWLPLVAFLLLLLAGMWRDHRVGHR